MHKFNELHIIISSFWWNITRIPSDSTEQHKRIPYMTIWTKILVELMHNWQSGLALYVKTHLLEIEKNLWNVTAPEILQHTGVGTEQWHIFSSYIYPKRLWAPLIKDVVVSPSLPLMLESYLIVQIWSDYAKLSSEKSGVWECQIILKNTPEIALWLSYFLTTKAVFWPHFCRLSYI